MVGKPEILRRSRTYGEILVLVTLFFFVHCAVTNDSLSSVWVLTNNNSTTFLSYRSLKCHFHYLKIKYIAQYYTHIIHLKKKKDKDSQSGQAKISTHQVPVESSETAWCAFFKRAAVSYTCFENPYPHLAYSNENFNI